MQLETKLQLQLVAISDLTLDFKTQRANSKMLSERIHETERCMSVLRDSVAAHIAETMARTSEAET